MAANIAFVCVPSARCVPLWIVNVRARGRAVGAAAGGIGTIPGGRRAAGHPGVRGERDHQRHQRGQHRAQRHPAEPAPTAPAAALAQRGGHHATDRRRTLRRQLGPQPRP
jgi:hypothetical protein